MDFPGVSSQEFTASAEAGEKSLATISDMVMKFANAQNESYTTFKEHKFGATLYPPFSGRPEKQMTQNAFNAKFKSELIKVLLKS